MKQTMIALVTVFAFAACNSTSTEPTTTDSTIVNADSVHYPIDSVKEVVDSVKSK